jgi:hypothetical protein
MMLNSLLEHPMAFVLIHHTKSSHLNCPLRRRCHQQFRHE